MTRRLHPRVHRYNAKTISTMHLTNAMPLGGSSAKAERNLNVYIPQMSGRRVANQTCLTLRSRDIFLPLFYVVYFPATV